MGKISDFLTGIKIIEKVQSPTNGEVTVIKSIAFGTYIQVSGLTQSGGIIHDIWNKTLKKNEIKKTNVKNCLILGLGGGSLVKVVNRYWPQAKITGVDIDPIMVNLGKKHLGLSDKTIKVHISDAFDFLAIHTKELKSSFDLILIDLYVGDEFPKKFEGEAFLALAKSYLGKNGFVIFNRLYYGEKRRQSMKFGDKLEKLFKKVEIFFPEANVMFVCSN